MRTFIFLSLFFLLTQSLAAQQTTDKSGTITRERYSISYPESWTIDTSKLYGIDLMIRSLKADSLDDFMENMNIIVQGLQGQNYTLTKMGQESMEQIKDMLTDFEVIESRLDSTATRQRYILKYTGRQGKYALTQIQHYYLKDDIGYALTFTFKRGKEADYASIAEKMFESFTLH